MTLIDCYTNGDEIVLWKQQSGKNFRTTVSYRATLYCDDTFTARRTLRKHGYTYKPLQKKTCWLEPRRVLEINARPSQFHFFIRMFERETKYRVPLYNADIPPELQYVHDHNLSFLKTPSFSTLEIEIPEHYAYKNTPLTQLRIQEEHIQGEEEDVLNKLAHAITKDPDVIIMPHAFRIIPYVQQRMQLHGIKCAWHRWDSAPITYKGGRSFFRYGLVTYHDFAIRLRGRLLINPKSMLGNCPLEGIWELAQLCTERPQHVASRSPGAVFQLALMRELYKEELLIPYKEKPPEVPISAPELLNSDRAGLTLDPLVGWHEDVAELDFFSMFPWLIHTKNISAERVLSREEPLVQAPGLDITVSHAHEGFVARTIKPFVEKRIAYKKDHSRDARARASALKGVLVSANGYLRFREFKLGLARTHMALCAHVREALILAKTIAESMGFTVVHGIVDALYVKKPGLTNVEHLRKRIQHATGIPLETEGFFRWIIFLPSTQDLARPVPTRYYGVHVDGTIKVRGLECRKRGMCPLVKNFQRECIEYLSQANNEEEFTERIPALKRLLKETILRQWNPQELICNVRIGKKTYTKNVPQKTIVHLLRKQRIPIEPGMVVKFIRTRKGVVLPPDFKKNPDTEYYATLLANSLKNILLF